VNDARQIDANAGLTAPKNGAKDLKGWKSPGNNVKNGVESECFIQI